LPDNFAGLNTLVFSFELVIAADRRIHGTSCEHVRIAAGTPERQRNRVLIVDDNSYVRELLSETFKREIVFEVCGATGNGREVLRIAKLLSPDLVIFYLSVPVMNGLNRNVPGLAPYG
jgi:PleD family two-component response regulator